MGAESAWHHGRRPRSFVRRPTLTERRHCLAGRTADLVAVCSSFLIEAMVGAERFDDAMTLGLEALGLVRQQGLLYLEPVIGWGLATSWLRLNDPDKSLAAAQSALDALTQAPDPATEFGLLAVAAEAALASGNRVQSLMFVDRFRKVADGEWSVIESLGEQRSLDFTPSSTRSPPPRTWPARASECPALHALPSERHSNRLNWCDSRIPVQRQALMRSSLTRFLG